MAEVGLGRGQCARPADAVYLTEAGEFDGVTDRRAGAVGLDHADGGGVDIGIAQRRSVQLRLRRCRRRGDVDRVAVLVGGGTADDRQDAVAVTHRVGQSFEQHHAGGFTADVAVGRGVERPAPSGGRQMALRGPRDVLARFEKDERRTGQRQVALAVVEAAASHVDGEQSRRAGGVQGERGSVHTQGVGDPPGGHGQRASLEAVRPFHLLGVGVHQLVVQVRQPHEHPGERVTDGLRCQAGVLHRLPGRFQ